MKQSLLLAALVSCLTSCSCEPNRDYDQRTVYDNQPATVVQPAPVYSSGGTTVIHDDNGSSLVQGMILGHMMSGGSRSGNDYSPSYRKKVVNKTTIINQTVRAPRGVTRTQATVTQRYTPSPMRTRSSMGSRSVRRR